MKPCIRFSLTVLFLSLLQACSGSGDGSSETGAETAAPAAVAPVASDAGSVAARFASNEDSRFLLLAAGQQSSSRGTAEQADSGAMTRLGSNTLSGAQRTVDISGDAHFALGRWVNGVVSQESGAKTLEGKSQQSFHYLAFNPLTEIPADGELQCTAVAATAPTNPSGNNAAVGSASGSARITLGAGGAAILGELQVRAGTETATVRLSTTIKDPASMSVTGQFFSGGSGAMIRLADQGGELPALVVGYKSQLPGGDTYIGAARFACAVQ